MKIRNKLTGQEFEVLEGSLIPHYFEKVEDNKDDEIKVGEPVVEYEIEETPEEKPKKEKKSPKKGKKNGNK